MITFSIITGVASLAESAGNLSFYAICYYICTTIVAIVLGIVMSVSIKPGSNVETPENNNAVQNVDETKHVVDGLLDIIRNCFPKNLVKATIDQAFTQRVTDFDTGEQTVKVTMSGTYDPITNETPRDASPNILGLIIFCSLFGYHLGKLASNGNNEAKLALSLFNGLNETIMKVVDIIMWYVPIGLIFLILLPTWIFSTMENWSLADSFYFSIISISTIGFGDYVPNMNPPIKYAGSSNLTI